MTCLTSCSNPRQQVARVSCTCPNLLPEASFLSNLTQTHAESTQQDARAPRRTAARVDGENIKTRLLYSVVKPQMFCKVVFYQSESRAEGLTGKKIRYLSFIYLFFGLLLLLFLQPLSSPSDRPSVCLTARHEESWD